MTSNPEMVEIVARENVGCGPELECEDCNSSCRFGCHNKATELLQALSPHYVERPVWSDTVPTVADWYWVEQPNSGIITPVNVFKYEGELLAGFEWGSPRLSGLVGYKWAPCPAPMED